MDKYKIDENIYVVENYHNNEPAQFITFEECFLSKGIKEGKIWEPFLHEVFEHYIDKDSIVLEGGTHIGTHTIKLSKLAGFVYCFEPLKESFNLLTRNLKLNDCNNVKPLNYALSDRRGKTKFKWEREGNLGASALIGNDMGFFKPRRNDMPSNNTITTVTIDSLHLRKLDFIKLDIEGFEKRVLQGGIKTIKEFMPVITMEIYGTNGETATDAYISNKFKFILDLGYEFKRLEHHTDFLFLPKK